jgi:hypothetical protein
MGFYVYCCLTSYRISSQYRQTEPDPLSGVPMPARQFRTQSLGLSKQMPNRGTISDHEDWSVKRLQYVRLIGIYVRLHYLNHNMRIVKFAD